METISILIPTYNEALNIKILIDRISHCLKKIDWEIIFVDDNSPDKTSEKIENLIKTQSNIKVVNRLNERGLAGAVITGLKYCKFQNIIVMDADLQHDPIHIPKLIKRIEKDDATKKLRAEYYPNSKSSLFAQAVNTDNGTGYGVGYNNKLTDNSNFKANFNRGPDKSYMAQLMLELGFK